MDARKPEYMFPDLQGLPEEFRRLAAEADEERSATAIASEWYEWNGRARALDQAAQMLEERLNG